MLRRGDREVSAKRRGSVRLPQAELCAGRGGLEKAERSARAVHRDFALGDVRGRADSASSAAQYRRPEEYGSDYRVSGREYAGAETGIRGEAGKDFRNSVGSSGGSGKSAGAERTCGRRGADGVDPAGGAKVKKRLSCPR